MVEIDRSYIEFHVSPQVRARPRTREMRDTKALPFSIADLLKSPATTPPRLKIRRRTKPTNICEDPLPTASLKQVRESSNLPLMYVGCIWQDAKVPCHRTEAKIVTDAASPPHALSLPPREISVLGVAPRPHTLNRVGGDVGSDRAPPAGGKALHKRPPELPAACAEAGPVIGHPACQAEWHSMQCPMVTR